MPLAKPDSGHSVRSSTIVDSLDPPVEPDAEDDDDINSQFEREAYGPFSPGKKAEDEFEVIMGPDDPDNPKTWSRPYRWYITVLSAVLVLNATFASSAPTGMVPQLIREFGFSTTVATLTISLFVAGYCVGPLIWGPLSEQIGRKPVFVGSFIVYTAFQVAAALSPNTAAILVFRFLGGVFAAAPLANSGAVVSDVWDADTRGKALAIFTLAPIGGPALGPMVSGFMDVAGVSWRWVFWVLTMFAGVCTIVVIFTLPETFVPVLLVKRAQKLRKETGDDRYWAPLEKAKMSFGKRAKHVLGRPFQVLFREPMLLAISLYMSFTFGCVYLLFAAYPIVFNQGHHMQEGISGLMFLPIFIGGSIAVAVYLAIFNPRYEATIRAFAPHPVPPEYRLGLSMYGAPVFAIAFFWFGWTSAPSISFWAPMLSGLPMGFGMVSIMLALFNYTIDSYLFVAASALSATTVMRSLFGAGFPMFAGEMYKKLSPQWASTLLGCLSLLMAPIPFVLRKWGHHIRRKSKYAPSGDGPLKPPTPEEKAAAVAEKQV